MSSTFLQQISYFVFSLCNLICFLLTFLISGFVSSPPSSQSESSPDAPETEGLTAEAVSHGELSIVGETLEDMSLSSNSSLDRNDTSQEYMDDFDNLGETAGTDASVLLFKIRTEGLGV